MLKLLVASTCLAIGSMCFAQEAVHFEFEYDTVTHYIKNWAEYEAECHARKIEPLYDVYVEEQQSYTGHCDFEEMAKLGIDEETELKILLEEVQ